MNVTREVILDLLPLYLAGEASPATRALVEEYLKQDSELAQRVREQSAADFATTTATPSPDLELKSLRRTRALITWQKWLFAFAICFTNQRNLLREWTLEGIPFPDTRFSGPVRIAGSAGDRLLDRVLLHSPPPSHPNTWRRMRKVSGGSLVA